MTEWKRQVRDAKRALIAHALACTGGKKAQAAKLLGMSRLSFCRVRSRLR